MSDKKSGVKFIRKGGRIIPIRAVAGAVRVGAVAGAAYAVKKNVKVFRASPKQAIKVNAGFDALGVGLSVASGAVGAATFAGGAKGFLGGFLVGHALDAGGIASNIASVAGKGKLKERAKQAARQEARNFLVGNAVYAAGLVGVKRNREKLAEYAGKIVAFARKALVRT